MRVFCAFFMFAWKFARKVQGAPQGVGLGFFFVIKSKRCQSLKLRGACTLCQWVFLVFWRIRSAAQFLEDTFFKQKCLVWCSVVRSLKPSKMCEIASKTGALYFLQMVMGDDKSIHLQKPWFESFFVFLITFYVFAPVRVRSVSRFAFGQSQTSSYPTLSFCSDPI